MSENTQAKLEKIGVDLSKQAPTLVILLFIVITFVYYLDRKDSYQLEESKRGDLVAIQRIEQCHAIQSQGTAVMAELSNVMREQGTTLVALTYAIEQHMARIEFKIDQLLEN